MSASLVGSEMCIRDRIKQTSDTGRKRKSGSIRSIKGVGIDGAAWPATVSYTHLTLPTICSV
eukprot:2835531-Alexandrium_andersonii.AAC.1